MNPFVDDNRVWHWLMTPARVGWDLADKIIGRRHGR